MVLKFRTFPDGGGVVYKIPYRLASAWPSGCICRVRARAKESCIQGEGVVCESSDVRKFLKKSKFQNFSELFKVKTRNYDRSRFQYESIHI